MVFSSQDVNNFDPKDTEVKKMCKKSTIRICKIIVATHLFRFYFEVVNFLFLVIDLNSTMPDVRWYTRSLDLET